MRIPRSRQKQKTFPEVYVFTRSTKKKSKSTQKYIYLSIIAVDRRIADSRKKAIRIGEVLGAILLPDSVATMATALASAPADSQRALLTGLLQTAGVPPLDVPGLLAAALDEPAPGSETPAVPPIAPAKVAPSTPRSTGGGGRLHHSPTDPLEMAAAQEDILASEALKRVEAQYTLGFATPKAKAWCRTGSRR